jgi:hypothetical protein
MADTLEKANAELKVRYMQVERTTIGSIHPSVVFERWVSIEI